ncbi:hypothetical protein MCOR25_010834 [Pyricularia grisea]|nr:hypothetical protein MCOR25_010834 [Pyricularia grisea]
MTNQYWTQPFVCDMATTLQNTSEDESGLFRARRQRMNVHQSIDLLYQNHTKLLYANSRLFDSYKSILQENIRLRQSAQLRSAHESDTDSEQDSRSQGQKQVRKNTSRHRPSEERVEQLQTNNLETALKSRFEICCPHCKYVIITDRPAGGSWIWRWLRPTVMVDKRGEKACQGSWLAWTNATISHGMRAKAGGWVWPRASSSLPSNAAICKSQF